MVIGTPNFMSPEQCGGQKVGPQADQYSLGVLGFQMLTGQLPFEADSIMGVIQHHYMTPPPDIAAVREAVPQELLDVIYKALAKKPEDRFATTHDMAEALEAVPLAADDRRQSLAMLKALSHGEPVAKVRTGSLPPMSLTASISGQRTAEAPPPGAPAPTRAERKAAKPKPKPKGKGGLVAAIVAVIVLAAGGGGAYWQLVLNKPAPPATNPTATAPSQGQPAGSQARPAPTPPETTASPPPSTSQPAQRPRQLEPRRQTPPTTTQATTSTPAPAPAAATGQLLIRTTPANAQVVVDGTTWGLGGGTRPLPAGSHTVQVTADGCQTFTQTVSVQAGQTTRLPVNLSCQ
jgi:serine/threonine-protein kinase